jgi:hypothetical protein
MGERVKFVYRDFYDVPRMIILTRRGIKLLLDSAFDESRDEYSPSYRVYVLPDKIHEHTLASWEDLPQTATRSLGEIPVDQVVFDRTKRAEVDATIIDGLLNSMKAGGPPL